MGRKKSKPVEANPETLSSAETDSVGTGTGNGSESTVTSKGRGPGRRQNGSSIQGYFRELLADRPDWVAMRSNEPIFKRWLEDHPGYDEVPQQVKNGLSNVKSALRNKARSAQKTRGRPRKVVTASEVIEISAPAVVVARKSISPTSKFEALEALEEQIDDLLSVAKSLGKDELQPVIIYLRRARNAVVLKMGE